MKEDENGFIYPEVDKSKCINCKLCENVCPSINTPKFYANQKCYAVYSKDERIRRASTSGGIATTVSINVINNGGIVYGAAFEENCNINHIRVENIDDLKKLQGSKYAHSYINKTYIEVKSDLEKDTNKQVLFIGTPCQIAGLKKYLGKDYSNLILMDIICHGVPSQKYLKDEVERINKNKDINRVNFRNGNKYGFFIKKNNEIVYEANIEDSPYCDAFMKTLSLRENCYTCNYANSKRVSDITIGDFWGLSENSKFYKDRNKGVSTVIISTEKGKLFFEKNKEHFYIEERPYIESVNGNTQLRIPAPKNKYANKFKKDYKKYGFYKAYMHNTRLSRLKRKIKKILRNRGHNGRIKN